MCRRGTLSCYSCSSGCAIPQPMPLPQVPVGVLCLSNVCLLSRIYIRAVHAFKLYILYQILRFLSLVPSLSASCQRPRMNQRRTKDEAKNSEIENVLFIKIAVSFPSLIPCLIPPWRSATERTPSIAPEKSPLWGLSAIHRMAHPLRVRSRMATG